MVALLAHCHPLVRDPDGGALAEGADGDLKLQLSYTKYYFFAGVFFGEILDVDFMKYRRKDGLRMLFPFYPPLYYDIKLFFIVHLFISFYS